MQTALWAAVVTVVQGQAGTEGNQGAEPRGSGTSGEPDHAGEIRGASWREPGLDAGTRAVSKAQTSCGRPWDAIRVLEQRDTDDTGTFARRKTGSGHMRMGREGRAP